jgi:hypothetical protein
MIAHPVANQQTRLWGTVLTAGLATPRDQPDHAGDSTWMTQAPGIPYQRFICEALERAIARKTTAWIMAQNADCNAPSRNARTQDLKPKHQRKT